MGKNKQLERHSLFETTQQKYKHEDSGHVTSEIGDWGDAASSFRFGYCPVARVPLCVCVLDSKHGKQKGSTNTWHVHLVGL